LEFTVQFDVKLHLKQLKYTTVKLSLKPGKGIKNV